MPPSKQNTPTFSRGFLLYNKIMITPNTDLILLKCPIELDQVNQLTFSNATVQHNYFNALPKLVEDGFTYQRKDGKIRFPACAEDLYSYNYCMYRNSSYSNKWFYAFITNIEYLNDNTSLISIVTDVWQTWQFDLNWHQSFVEREHTNNDAIGANILDEGIECGEYVCNGTGNASYSGGASDCYIVIQCSDLPDELKTVEVAKFPVGARIGGIPQGFFMYLLDANDSTNMKNFVLIFDAFGKGEAINAMYLVPKSFFPNAYSVSIGDIEDPTTHEKYSFDGFVLRPSDGVTTLWNSYFLRNSTINGYTPKNNKLFCYPYNYMLMSNNDGDDAVFHWEDFSSNQAHFKVIGVPTQGCVIKIVPTNYKGTTTGHDGYIYSLNARSLPLVSWNSDYYLNWQAQNGIKSGANAATKYASSYAQAGKDVQQAGETGSFWDAINPANILKGVASTLSSFGQMFSSIKNEVSGGYTAEMTPNQTRGQSNGDLNFSYSKMQFTEYDMSIKAEVARSIDNYFSMYGYRTSRVKIPNITGRQNWNYVKTIGCNVTGNIPQEDMQAIKNMCDTGVTFWHNPATFRDYSQNNNIV